MWDTAASIIVLAEASVFDGIGDVFLGFSFVSADTEIMVATTINLEFVVVGVSCDVKMITGVWDVAIIGVVTTIGVDVVADMNVNGLAAVMTTLEFALRAP